MNQIITVLFGGPSPEHDISILTGLQCERILAEASQPVQAVYWTRNGEWRLVEAGREAKDFLDGAPAGSLKLEFRLDAEPGFYRRGALRTRPLPLGIVLNCCHGGPGEAGTLNGLFEMLGIPATGGPSAAAALGMDKLAFGAVVNSAGLPSLPRAPLLENGPDPTHGGPYIVKPRYGGSSLGIEIVHDLTTARDLLATSPLLRAGAVIEPYKAGADDLNIAFRTHPSFESSLLERPLRAADSFYSYSDKYLQGGEGLVSAPREIPAKVPDQVAEQARKLARAIANLVGVSGITRLDFLLSGGELYINEINTIPGAMALYLWPDQISYAQLLLDMVAEARGRKYLATSSAKHTGAALRTAGGIAGKLVRLSGQVET
ncbi:MAG: hypothetical protein ACRDRW_02255 [Pseudonocardiaceae bacterium]